MKQKLLKVLVALYNAGVRLASWVKRELIKLEVWIKSMVAVAFTSGFVTLQDFYQHGRSFELTAAHLLELKAKFISGAVIGLVMYWAKSPIGNSRSQTKEK